MVRDREVQSRSPALEPDVDAEIVERLALEKFQGVLWNTFANHLAERGLKVLQPWIATKGIFQKMREKHVRCSAAVELTEPDAVELAADTVTRAIPAFRVKMLESGRWVPDGGATLETLFINQCLHQFPNVYRTWLRERRARPADLALDARELGRRADETHRARPDIAHAAGGAEPEATAISRQRCAHLLSLLPDRLRAVVQLVEQGHSLRSAAELLGESYDTVKRELQKLRPELRRELETLEEEDR